MQEEITLFPMKQQHNWKKYELQFIAEYMQHGRFKFKFFCRKKLAKSTCMCMI